MKRLRNAGDLETIAAGLLMGAKTGLRKFSLLIFAPVWLSLG